VLSFITKWQFAQIQNIRSYIYLHFPPVGTSLPDATALTYLFYILSQVQHVPFSCTTLPELVQDLKIKSYHRIFSQRSDDYTKLYQTLSQIYSHCSLIHVPTPREKQNRKHHYFSVYLRY
jgi:hypothetical protein